MIDLPTIPVAYPLARYQNSKDAIQQAIFGVLASGQYILGKNVEAFEREFAEYHGVEYCIGVANGTDAVALALKSCGVQAGDEVITVAHTAVATVSAIEYIGAIPVICDIDAQTRCLHPARIAELISPKTRALLPVHIYGHPCDMPAVMSVAEQYNLIVVEDCAQAHGAMIAGQKVGTFGHASAYSFYPTKNLGCFGDGGAILTRNSTIADQARMLRQYGWKERYISATAGYNSRLDEMQAAILRVHLPYLDAENERRINIAARYCATLEHLNHTYLDFPSQKRIYPPSIAEGIRHVMHLFVVECADRTMLADFLGRHGVGTGLHYPQAIHRQTAYIQRLRGADTLPVTDELYERILSLPMFPELDDASVARVCAGLEAWYAYHHHDLSQ